MVGKRKIGEEPLIVIKFFYNVSNAYLHYLNLACSNCTTRMCMKTATAIHLPARYLMLPYSHAKICLYYQCTVIPEKYSITLHYITLHFLIKFNKTDVLYRNQQNMSDICGDTVGNRPKGYPCFLLAGDILGNAPSGSPLYLCIFQIVSATR
jgi:hypothetical protein